LPTQLGYDLLTLVHTMTDFPSTFGTLLRRYRTLIGLTQEELAERARISVRAVSDLERGVRRSPYRGTVHQLAEALELQEGERDALFAAAERPVGGRSATEPAGDAPDEPTAFIGRERELGEVSALVQRPGMRLVTLTGPGGIGKSRLALQVANTLRSAFPDGVYPVFLAPLSDPDLVGSAIVSAVGIDDRLGPVPLTALTTALAGQRVLLVLDNFEHVLRAAPIVSELLAGCTNLRVLVTSRSILHLSREQEYPVPPLSLPGAAPDEVASDAIALFVARAQSAKPDFQVTDSTLATITDICRRLDGLPLAIELAAARLRLFSPPALLQRLSRRLPLLTGGPTDAPERQLTLRSTIDWSYDLLGEQDRRLFARLSVFAGGCTFETAEFVCNADGDLDLLEGLSSLLDQSLIRRAGADEPRFAMLETIREYATEQLEEAGGGEHLRRRHARCFLSMAEDADSGVARAEGLDRLDSELDNMRAALSWARDRGEAVLGLQLAVSLAPFWELRGYLTEGRAWLDQFLRAAGVEDCELRVRAFIVAARLALAQHDVLTAREMGHQGFDLAKERGNNREMVEALHEIGFADLHLGEFSAAATDFKEGAKLASAFADTALTGHLLWGLTWAQALAGDLDEAVKIGEQGLDLARRLHDPVLTSALQDGLIHVARIRGDAAHAREVFREARRALQEPDIRIDGFTRELFERHSMTARSWGDYADAHGLLERAMDLARAIGDQQAAMHCQVVVAVLEREQGRYDRAAELLEESLTVFGAAHDPFGRARALLGLSDVARDRGDAVALRKFAGESLALCRQLGDSLTTSFCLNNLAMAAYLDADYDHAESLLEEALPRSIPGETRGEVTATLALVKLARGDYTRAGVLLHEVMSTMRAGDNWWLVPILLDLAAVAAAGQGNAERAARLVGAGQAMHEALGTPNLPLIRAIYDAHLAQTREVLGPDAFEAVQQAGRVMTVDEALAFALGKAPSSDSAIAPS
jgi:predicted ATPase/DNA-binding XRE family transcriptional regulator